MAAETVCYYSSWCLCVSTWVHYCHRWCHRWCHWWAYLSRWDSGCSQSNVILHTPSEQIQTEHSQSWSSTQICMRTPLSVLQKQQSHSLTLCRQQLLSSGSSQSNSLVSSLPDVSPPVFLHSDCLLPPTWQTLNRNKRVVSKRSEFKKRLNWDLTLFIYFSFFIYLLSCDFLQPGVL